MTDGQQSFANDQTPLDQAVKPLEDASVLRYAVGIGNEISPFELETIAGPRVITADNYDELQAKIEDQILLLGRVGCRGWSFPTAQKMKFSIKDFFSKCDQIRSLLRIRSHLMKKSLMENFIFMQCPQYK